MAMQSSATLKNFPLILSGALLVRDNETLLTDGARATVLKRGTVMAQVAASKKWVPLTDIAAVTTGAAVARGILLSEDVTAAALVAGDVTGQVILVGGAAVTLDAQQVVLENYLTLNTVVSDDPAGADNDVVNVRRNEDDLARIGLFVENTIDISKLEN
jgi:hypothetical protein